jgi:membrane-associated phospholipid phosphatase
MTPRLTSVIPSICLGLTCLISARGNVVLDWNAVMMAAIRIDNTGPTLSSRNLAILHVAIYDAVNSVAGTHQPYLGSLEVAEPVSAEAAAAAAGYEVLKVLYPGIRPRSDETFETWRDAAPATAATTNGITLGIRCANRLLDARAADGSATDVPYIPSSAPGQWRRTPPFFRPPLTPGWLYVTPFAIPDADDFRSPPPPALHSPEYARDFEEVRALGSRNSTVRTPEQTLIARYWSDFSYTAMPPGHWHEIASAILGNQGIPLEPTARAMALLSLAQADAAIVCWDAKFRYNLWRPVTAIQRAGEDGNPATAPEPDWDHLLAAPPFPAYPSGHSTFSQASASILADFMGTDAVQFTTASDSVPGVFRSYSSLSACAAEIGRSRIYGGIHFEFDNREGKRIGATVARHVTANWLLPNESLPLLRIERTTTATQTAAPEIKLRLHGRPGTRLVLESSPDLQSWVSLTTVPAALGGVAITTVSGTSNGNGTASPRFFRVREALTR